MKRSFYFMIGLSVFALSLSGCNDSTPTMKPLPTSAEKAQAEIINGKGKKIGKAEFWQEQDYVMARITVQDLPKGPHGIHVHTVGKCDIPTFETAGPHFNPAHKKHGTENVEGPHAGDLPNLEINDNGEGMAEFALENVTLKGNEDNSLFHPGGTAIVIHKDKDDYKTDPSGNSGARIACGVIQNSSK
ncbi:superoxide dismutase, Cu-Zn family [Thermoactinomyces sp. DSM 45891]|uniref:superoxide dismutase family protein n=1 Tax=Thermoactinomyces sp. DSM 45891 TaxID=1761907 RepID=UPI000920BB2F|nr:superoxide dismutase family protein [Thermoactinomyces sp. DSM 45891]SFX49681.1 superoxide dismutase, Cu-Zn family [Thermoactinomyces sp. DSM 45891]